MKDKIKFFQERITQSEYELFEKLNVRERLLNITSTSEGLKEFAETFHFIRYKFFKLNFIVGARCSFDELEWGGLARCLFEELGGENGKTHNQLYRDFLTSVGGRTDYELLREEEEPNFAKEFNNIWETYCSEKPLLEVLSAMAVYEILDNPDYQLLLDIMQQSNVSKEGQIFFKVHAKADHFDLFEDFAEKMFENYESEKIVEQAEKHVHDTQAKMWENLLNYLENKENKSSYFNVFFSKASRVPIPLVH